MLIILNGIAENLNNEYLRDNIQFDCLYSNMNKLQKINSIFNKIEYPLLIHKATLTNYITINHKLQGIHYLLHSVIKECGAKSCAHIMQVFLSRNWYFFPKLNFFILSIFSIFLTRYLLCS